MPPSFFWRTSSGFLPASWAVAGREKHASASAAARNRVIALLLFKPLITRRPAMDYPSNNCTTRRRETPLETLNPGDFREPFRVQVLEWGIDVVHPFHRNGPAAASDDAVQGGRD